MIKSSIKLLLHSVFADYRINWIVAAGQGNAKSALRHAPIPIIPLMPEHYDRLLKSKTQKMRNATSPVKASLSGFVLEDEAIPVCVAHFANSAQYAYTSTWPITSNQVALIDIVTEENYRGRGLAVQMIEATTSHYLEQGYDKLIAFIWWSNTPSVRAFSKAGWHKIGLSIEILIGEKWRCLRLPIFWA